jgi:prepilin-type N-terminal cleavage/methylation domain-containing protein
MRHWLKNERGFTMAELLVATAVAGLVMAGVFLVLRGGQQAYLLGSSRVETQQNARVALDLMTRELRSATSITLIPGTTDITFQDQTTPPEDDPVRACRYHAEPHRRRDHHGAHRGRAGPRDDVLPRVRRLQRHLHDHD